MGIVRALIVGGGGREHALAWACRRDAPDAEILVAPGNAGTADLAENIALDVEDARAVARVAGDREVDLVVIGPDAAAAAGVADACIERGIAVFGPSAAAARIESSKTFAKQVMDEAGIPTPRWVAGGAEDRRRLSEFVAERGGACVVKADGLALGKGVLVCAGVEEAERALDACLGELRFGEAGRQVVVEERLDGVEVSVFGLSDGHRVRTLLPARDHKRIFDGDQGPNTGGMGAVAPPSDIDAAAFVAEVSRTVLGPCVDALRERGAPFVGCLYAGLMLTAGGIRVLEFNARFGDPEAQVVLPLLDEPALELFARCARGEVEAGAARAAGGAAVGVVAAAAGYPGDVRRGDVITGIDSLDDDVLCFHAGTRRDSDGTLRASGGRVLCITVTASDIESARTRAYANLARVHFDGMQARTDIGLPVIAGARA
ncbi:MAG: phosphoribosylamine---glycine ligase [Chloroflexota bacterium]|nr:phosphoribosylamine---glycine ligase [Chloroflexota bacterium]